jgi:hypothetical protein
LGVPNTVTVGGLPARGVQLISESLDMPMSRIPYTATPLGGRRWQARNVYPLMKGHYLVGRALEMDMGEVPAVARAVAPGRYVAVADVVMASDWQVVAVQRGHVVTHTAFSYFAHY